MSGQTDARPVIIKRKKVVRGGGHHGGAWKVAYADFVTAMMAFFMLMWLLNATTEKQRKGLADYFSPTIPINRVSGGGEGAFGGNSVFSEDVQAQNGTGGTMGDPSSADKNGGEGGISASMDAEALKAEASEVDKALAGRSGESMTMQRALRHVVTRITDEGLVIELFDLEGAPLFEGTTPTQVTRDLAAMLADVLAITTNEVAVNGHVASFPITLIVNPEWDLSSARAETLRSLLQAGGMPPSRMARVSGFADRKPATGNPMAVRNNRLEVVLLRRDL